MDPTRARAVRTGEDLEIIFEDGRILHVPFWWFPKLLAATPEQRGSSRMIGHGEGIHWPDLDEYISVRRCLAGYPAKGAVRPK